MSEVYFISDTHFGHANICNFTRDDGSKLRPFNSVEENDECIIENWNKLVKPKDKIYHLGDVVINRKSLKILEKLNGTKVLIKGNHDIFKLDDYSKYFKDIRSVHRICNKYILSHIPIHDACLNDKYINVHGHLHYRCIVNQDGTLNKKYLNISVEMTDYAPVNVGWIEKKCNS